MTNSLITPGRLPYLTNLISWTPLFWFLSLLMMTIRTCAIGFAQDNFITVLVNTVSFRPKNLKVKLFILLILFVQCFLHKLNVISSWTTLGCTVRKMDHEKETILSVALQIQCRNRFTRRANRVVGLQYSFWYWFEKVILEI